MQLYGPILTISSLMIYEYRYVRWLAFVLSHTNNMTRTCLGTSIPENITSLEIIMGKKE